MQFRLKSLFVLVLVVAAVCGVFFALPDWLSLIVLIAGGNMILPAAITGIVFGEGGPGVRRLAWTLVRGMPEGASAGTFGSRASVTEAP